MSYRPTLHHTKRVRSTRIARKKVCQLPVQFRGSLQIVCEKNLNVCLIDWLIERCLRSSDKYFKQIQDEESILMMSYDEWTLYVLDRHAEPNF